MSQTLTSHNAILATKIAILKIGSAAGLMQPAAALLSDRRRRRPGLGRARPRGKSRRDRTRSHPLAVARLPAASRQRRLPSPVDDARDWGGRAVEVFATAGGDDWRYGGPKTEPRSK